MTLFNQENKDQIQALDPNKDYYAELVGEGKAFKDNQALARGKVESNNFITQLTRENAELRKEMDKLTNEVRSRQTVEELLKTNLQANTNTQSSQNNQGKEQPEENAQTLTPQDIEDLLNRREQKKSSEENMNSVRQRLEQEWGPTYSLKLQDVAKSLGVGNQFLDDIARTQPQAFFQLVGLNANPGAPPTGLPQRSVSTEALQALKGQKVERGYSYYSALRKQDSRKFFTPAVQTEMFKRIQEIGEDQFYKN